MAIVSAATITTIAKASAPIISDLYNTAKEKARQALSRWKEQQFPKRLAKKIGNLSLVRTLWHPENDISLLKFYYPPKVQPIGSSTALIANSINDINNENFIIQGIVGQGKSILLRWLAVQEAKSEKSARLPIFIELRTLHAKYLLRDAIYKELESFDITINEEAFIHLARSGKFLLLLDAFDELDENLTRETLNEIIFLSRKYEKMQIIITSRPGNEIQKISGFKIMNICSLTADDYSPFLKKMGLTTIKNFEVVDAIKNSRGSLAELITTPLMLTLVAIVYESEREIPNTLPDFFERLFHIVLTRHDRLKDGFNRKRCSELSDRKLQDLFEAFCFMTIQNTYGRSLSNEQFTKTFRDALDYTENCQCEQEEFQKDIVKGACLMLEEGVDTTTFLHKSLMEYYAAAFIKHSTDEVAELFYKEASKSHRQWHEVIGFLSSIDPYRFSKNFALPQIENTYIQHIKPLNTKETKELIKVFTKNIKNSCIYFRNINKKDVFDIGVFQVVKNPGYYTEQLNSMNLHCVLKNMPHVATLEQLENILSKKIDILIEDNQVEIPFFESLTHIGEENYWNTIQLYEQWVMKQKQNADSIISINDKRKAIFSKNKSKTK